MVTSGAISYSTKVPRIISGPSEEEIRAFMSTSKEERSNSDLFFEVIEEGIGSRKIWLKEVTPIKLDYLRDHPEEAAENYKTYYVLHVDDPSFRWFCFSPEKKRGCVQPI